MSMVQGSRKGGHTVKHRPLLRNAKIINPNRNTSQAANGNKTPTHLRSNATIKRLAMYETRTLRNAKGEFLSGMLESRVATDRIKRIAPDRRWFGNTRVVGQEELNSFREEMDIKSHDPYSVVMNSAKLPLALLNDSFTGAKGRMNLLTTQSFAETFGKAKQRKKPRIATAQSNESLLSHVQSKQSAYDEVKDVRSNTLGCVGDDKHIDSAHSQKHLFEKGQSRRIWAELYKVIDCSDVLIQVLDVRDPMGTRCKRIESELKKQDRRHKHLVLVLNKCENLVPTWVTQRWVKLLSQEYPTLAFHASLTNPFGKGALIQLLRQFGGLHRSDGGGERQISVGFVGFPNVGKSSIINTLRNKNVCVAAPTPGETRCWKYITLFKKIFLIDCPGVSPRDTTDSTTTDLDCVLKGAIRIDKLTQPSQFIDGLMARVKREYLANTYHISEWETSTEFLEHHARATGKLLKGGEPDCESAARMILNDWQRGRIPYFVKPPFEDEIKAQAELRAAAQAKSRKAKDEGVQGVHQLFDKVHVRPQFTTEDTRGDRAEIATGEESAASSTATATDADQQATTTAAPVDYDALYESVDGEDVDAAEAEAALHITHTDEQPDDDEQLDEEDDEMTTQQTEGQVARTVPHSKSTTCQPLAAPVADVKPSHNTASTLNSTDDDDCRLSSAPNDGNRKRKHQEVELSDESEVETNQTRQQSKGSKRRFASLMEPAQPLKALQDTQPRSAKSKNRSKKKAQQKRKMEKKNFKRQ